MSACLSDSMHSYISSDYSVDDKYQGFLLFNAHANLGRAISLVDITSQAGKAVFGTAASAVISVGRITAGAGSLLVAIPSSLIWGVTNLCGWKCKDFFREKTISFFQFGLENVMKGLFTISVGIPLSLLWRVFMVVADVLGIFLPEVGRWARNLNKILNAVLANMNENRAKGQKVSGKDTTTEQARSQERSGPQHRHNFKPFADMLGGFTTQKALEVLGLKQGASLAEVKKAAHMLYLKHHPDKGGKAEDFQEVRRAEKFLREQCQSVSAHYSWKFGNNSQTATSTSRRESVPQQSVAIMQ